MHLSLKTHTERRNETNQDSKWKKISASMVALPSFPSSPQTSLILATDRCKHQQPVA